MKPKRQGTAYETEVVNYLSSRGFPAARLAEGGRRDRGDIGFDADGEAWIVECKARERLSLHQAVAKAESKAGADPVVVFWRRLVSSEGGKRRKPNGVREVVAMTPEVFIRLLGRGSQSPQSSQRPLEASESRENTRPSVNYRRGGEKPGELIREGLEDETRVCRLCGGRGEIIGRAYDYANDRSENVSDDCPMCDGIGTYDA